MKSILYLFLLGILTQPIPTPVKTVDLKSALENGHLQMEVIGNGLSTHYLKPISIDLQNTGVEPINIKIPIGQIFHAKDSSIQDVIVTQETLIALRAGERTQQDVYAMCIEQQLSGNNDSINYSLGDLANGEVLELVDLIRQRKDFNIVGQYALWCLIDEGELGMISGIDSNSVTFYRDFVAEKRNILVPEFDPQDYQTNYEDASLIKRSAKGSFKYKFSKVSHVTIALFDESGIVVRELYNNPQESSGHHELDFEFDMEVYRDEVYYVRLIQDDEVQIEFKMATNRG